MQCREQSSHTQGVYPTQATSRIDTESINQKEEAVIKIINKKKED